MKSETGVSTLGKRTASVKAWIEAKAAAEGRPYSPRKSAPPLVIIYKVMSKMFAILSVRGVEDVILKCDPSLVPVLHEKYDGIGHRSHLDARSWISVRLDADVPMKEIRRLVSLSYDLVCAGLTAKQRAELARLALRAPGPTSAARSAPAMDATYSLARPSRRAAD